MRSKYIVAQAWCDKRTSNTVMDSNLAEVFSEILDRETTTAKNMDRIAEAIQANPDYAWSWHCNIAMASVDEGMEHKAANRAAARFMYMCFGCDTSKLSFYKDLIK
jgi:hypothetical protein